MKKICISMAIAVAAVYFEPAAFAQNNPASTNQAVELAFWNSVKDSRDPDELQAYINKYPSGQFAELAALRKRNLEKSKTLSDAAGANPKGQSSKFAVNNTKPDAQGIDPKFNQYIAELREMIGPRGRVDIRRVLPRLLPVSPANMRKVDAMASLLFEAPFPSAGAIAISSTGQVAIGTSTYSYPYQASAETIALADCNSKRKDVENSASKCEIFFKSRMIDTRVLFNMLEKASGPDFDSWVKALNESISTLRTRAPIAPSR